MNAISDQIGMDLLRVYVAVCRQGSLNRVAEMSRRSQSGISMQIRKLEQLLDCRLLQRTGRGVVLTEQGELFLAYAKRILAVTDEVLSRLSERDRGQMVRIGVADEWCGEYVGLALSKVRQNYPEVTIELLVEQSLVLGERWRDGLLDVMVAPSSAVRDEATNTWNVALEWVCAPTYSITEAGVLDLVALSAPCMWRQQMLDSVSAMGRSYRIAFTSKSGRALAEAVKGGFGIGLLPSPVLSGNQFKKLGLAEGFPPAPVVQYGLFVRDPRDAITTGIGALFDFPSAGACRCITD